MIKLVAVTAVRLRTRNIGARDYARAAAARAIPFYADGTPGPALELHDLFERFLIETRD